MFYTRAEQMQRTGYWCMSAIPIHRTSKFPSTPVRSPHERHCHHLLGLTRFRLHPYPNPGLRTLAMVSHYNGFSDVSHLDTLLVLLPRFSDQRPVLDPGGEG